MDDDDLLLPRRPRPEKPRTRGQKTLRPTATGDAPIVPRGPFLGKRAVVLGGSIAGMLAARVLSDHFAHVVILERDYLHDRPVSRKGVPQARQGHVLLQAGAKIIGELFPEIGDDMDGAGARGCDAAKELHWFHFGVYKAKINSGIRIYLLNRMLFEGVLRRQLRRRANVEFIDEADVLGLEMDADKTRVVGVRYAPRREEGERLATGDLVIDASGRGSRTPRWLSEAGYPRVVESEVKVGVAYASRVYRVPRDVPEADLRRAAFPKPPETRRFGVMYPMGDGVLMVTLAGWLRDHPPTKDEGFTAFARSLPTPEFGEVLGRCKPAPAIHGHQIPSSLRRRYEAMERWPEGLVVLGDALCSFNPTYAQGISVAALEVERLRRRLEVTGRRRRSIRSPGLARRIQRDVAGALMVPWLMASCEDLRFPQVVGHRPFWLPLIQWYVARVLELSATHGGVLRRFLLIMNLLRGPTVLMAPTVIFAVLIQGIRRARMRRPRAIEAARDEPLPSASSSLSRRLDAADGLE